MSDRMNFNVCGTYQYFGIQLYVLTLDKRSFVQLAFVGSVTVLSKGRQEWKSQASCDLCMVYTILVLVRNSI